MGKIKVVCAGCGKESRQDKFEYINPEKLAMPDLDLRPSGAARNSFKALIQQCPGCGYCAPDISVKPENLNMIMSSDDYSVLANSKYFPEQSKKYLKSGFILQASGSDNQAIKSFIYSAWACDDENNYTGARISRQMALGYYMNVLHSSGRLHCFETPFRDECIITDLLRREGSLGEARNRCKKALEEIKEDKERYENPESRPVTIEEETLLFQQGLIAGNDRGCHSFNEFYKQETVEVPDGCVFIFGVGEDDPIEDDPRYWEIIQQVNDEVNKALSADGQIYMGYCHYFWSEKKKLLKKRYGIKWRSPSDLNPSIHYD